MIEEVKYSINDTIYFAYDKQIYIGTVVDSTFSSTNTFYLVMVTGVYCGNSVVDDDKGILVSVLEKDAFSSKEDLIKSL